MSIPNAHGNKDIWNERAKLNQQKNSRIQGTSQPVSVGSSSSIFLPPVNAVKDCALAIPRHDLQKIELFLLVKTWRKQVQKSFVFLLRLCFPFASHLSCLSWWWQFHHLISISWRRSPASQYWLFAAGRYSSSATVRALKLPLEVKVAADNSACLLSQQMFTYGVRRHSRGCFFCF